VLLLTISLLVSISNVAGKGNKILLKALILCGTTSGTKQAIHFLVMMV